ncbi:MAG: hydroxysqualene dehydroxylase HpnE [Actinobacteria bacterium]|nr:hydroxysqualene dehydroxylase HpnE [Actinomycetota bacterium]
MRGRDAAAPDVVVVGGGLAGISAALSAADAGARVVLLEKRSRLGGAAASVFRRGRWHDNGQHVFLRCCSAYRSLIARLGGEQHLFLQERLEVPVLRPGRPPQWIRRSSLPAPLHLAEAIARYGHLCAVERLRVGAAAWALRGLDGDDCSLDQRTFASWLHEHGQSDRAVDCLWDLIALPTLNVRAPEASLLAAARTFRMGLLRDATAADIGWATVPLSRLHNDLARDALAAAGVSARLRCRVAAVDGTSGDAVRLLLDDGSRLEAGAAIVAVPHYAVPGLLPAAPPEFADGLRRLGVSPIVNLHLHYDRSVTPFAVAACLGTTAQWVFDRSAMVGSEPGRSLVVSLSAADDCLRLAAAPLLDRVTRDLQRVFPAARGAALLEAHVTRAPRATFRAAVGSDAHRAGSRSPVPGVFLAGAWTATGWPATMEGAVLSGRAAAQALAEGQEGVC